MSIYVPLKFCPAKFSMGDSIITHFMIYDIISTASVIRFIILQMLIMSIYIPLKFCSAKFSMGDSIITHFLVYDRINSQHKKGLTNNRYLQFVKAERLDL